MKEKLYSMYKEICTQMEDLADLIGSDREIRIKSLAKRVVINTIRLDGYIECLCDLDALSRDNAEKFSNFTNQVRNDVNQLLSLYPELR